MSEHPITQATELRNVAEQLAMFIGESKWQPIARNIAERAEQLLNDLRVVLDEPRQRIPSNKSEWE
jgi:hypothetical protein